MLLLVLLWPIEAAVVIELIAATLRPGAAVGAPVEALVAGGTVITVGLVHRSELVYAALPEFEHSHKELGQRKLSFFTFLTNSVNS